MGAQGKFKTMNRRSFLLNGTALMGLFGLGAFYWPIRWRYIVIHHSAGSYGSIEFLQKVHKERQANDPIDAIPYHFVIGNGNGLGDGEIASDLRKKYNIWGAHVSGKNTDRNLRGIGICLIGNFEKEKVTSQQYDSLVSLTKRVMQTYGISANNVTGHGYTPGESTKCPGKNFPMGRFLSDIA